VKQNNLKILIQDIKNLRKEILPRPSKMVISSYPHPSNYSSSGFLKLYSLPVPNKSAQNLWNGNTPILFDANAPNPSQNCLANTDMLR